MGEWGNGRMGPSIRSISPKGDLKHSGTGGEGKWGNGRMGKWENGKMREWGNGEMGKWGDGGTSTIRHQTSTIIFPRSAFFAANGGGLRLLLWYNFKSKISDYEKEAGGDGNGRNNSKYVRCFM